MILARRRFLKMGGGFIATLSLSTPMRAATVQTINMEGSARGERIWFSPNGLAISPGTTLRFVNRDQGNAHTATAYCPELYDRARRIPKAAAPWDSGFLLPDESFEVTLTVPGVYDYYCIPHEMAAMVGRIVVGQPGDPGWQFPNPDTDDIAPEALTALPTVETILTYGRVEPEGAT
nr:plastocyanin/azurin family copper-binding protein [Pseudohalocynthiibacter aestuariivivens]